DHALAIADLRVTAEHAPEGNASPALLELLEGPQRPGDVLEELGLELLPTHPCALVAGEDLLPEGRREVGEVLVRTAPGDVAGQRLAGARVDPVDEITNEPDGARRG